MAPSSLSALVRRPASPTQKENLLLRWPMPTTLSDQFVEFGADRIVFPRRMDVLIVVGTALIRAALRGGLVVHAKTAVQVQLPGCQN